MTNPSRKIQLQLVKTSPIGIRLPGSGENAFLSSSMLSRAALTKFEFKGTKNLSPQTFKDLDQLLDLGCTQRRNGLKYESIAFQFGDFYAAIFCSPCLESTMSLGLTLNVWTWDLTVLKNMIPIESFGPTIIFRFCICIAASKALNM